jgi:hypothetical protein
MTDDAFATVTVGTRVRFFADPCWREGTVRRIPTTGVWDGWVLVDDGDPANNDLHTNGFHVSAWLEPRDIELLGEP